MNLGSLPMGQLVRQLLARNVPIATDDFGSPTYAIDSLGSQLHRYLYN
jgi:hypothetical protein